MWFLSLKSWKSQGRQTHIRSQPPVMKARIVWLWERRTQKSVNSNSKSHSIYPNWDTVQALYTQSNPMSWVYYWPHFIPWNTEAQGDLVPGGLDPRSVATKRVLPNTTQTALCQNENNGRLKAYFLITDHSRLGRCLHPGHSHQPKNLGLQESKL